MMESGADVDVQDGVKSLSRSVLYAAISGWTAAMTSAGSLSHIGRRQKLQLPPGVGLSRRPSTLQQVAGELHRKVIDALLGAGADPNRGAGDCT